jgi:plastocyanin
MPIRDIYLKIEQIPDYNPVDPEQKVVPPKEYKRDCMRNMGHEDGTIPVSEVNARKLNALVYREYLDPNYQIPKPDKIVIADVNEPAYYRRVPGTVIYAQPEDRLRIHVLNSDTIPHSLHVHGLAYGIDSDGTWPFGTQSSDGRRSDEICSGQTWTYRFDVREEMIGAWPFHDHHRHIVENVNLGLFGAIIVLPQRYRYPPPTLKLPDELAKILEDLRKWPYIPRPIPLPPLGPTPIHPPHMASNIGGSIRGGVHDIVMHSRPGSGRHSTSNHNHNHNHNQQPSSILEAYPTLKDLLEFLHEWVHLKYLHAIPRPPAVLHVPLFYHLISGAGSPAFRSGPLSTGSVFDVTFGVEGEFKYHCEFHPIMQGTVKVSMGGPAQASVSIEDTPDMKFNPPSVTISPGGIVRWTHNGVYDHTVTDDGAGIPSYCFNGRAFVGNTPTIVAWSGQRIRWYVFNLDLGMLWHNFHPHAQRWKFADENIDVRSLGPAESFVVETTVPPVLILPPDIEKAQNQKYRPRGAKKYIIRADFPFHCHVEMHMMQGMVGLVRSRQEVWLTQKQADQIAIETGLPIELDPDDNACPPVDYQRCIRLGLGRWEEVPGAPEVAMMHSLLLPNTMKVLYWGYDRIDQSRLWDYSTPAGAYSPPANQPADVAPTPGDIVLSNIWSAEHAFFSDGRALIHGGFTPKQSYIFDPATLRWSRTAPTVDDRFYATTLTLSDGRILTLFGSASKSIEVYDPTSNTWTTPKPLPMSFVYEWYPWTYLLPGGDLFIAGPTGVTRRFDWTANPIVDDPAKTWMTIAGNRSTGGEKGTSVLLPLRPPYYESRVLIAGGDPLPAQQTAEVIDLSLTSPAWTSLPNLNQPRPEQVNSVLLPDGRVFIAGGIIGTGGPVELIDSSNLGSGWILGPSMTYQRGYHSSAILLADGSVLMGGDPRTPAGISTPHERYFPSYYFMSRPVITTISPATTTYGSTFTIQTPDAPSIAEVVLLRPGAVTHGFNMSQRFVGCAVTGRNPNSIQVQAPPDGNVAPPGYYLLFIVNGGRIPSVAKWIHIRP